MSNTGHKEDEVDRLRVQAEKISSSIKESFSRSPAKKLHPKVSALNNSEHLTSGDLRNLYHELEVHQIELEVQNVELKQAQAELEVSRAKYIDLYNQAPVGYFTLNEQGIILECNRTSCLMLNVIASEFIKYPITKFIFPEDRDRYYLYSKKLTENGQYQTFEVRMLKKGEPEFWICMETVEVHTSNSSPLYRVVISNIAERKKAAEEERSLIKAKSDFISMVTHELRSPLSAIKMGLDIIFQEPEENLNEKQIEILALSRNSINRIIRLINATLDLQKISCGALSLDIQKYNINDVVQEVKSSMLCWAKEKNICIETKLDNSLLPIQFDRDKIIQVLVNLISNSIKFSDKGIITVSTLFHENAVVVSVKDEGIGIEKKDIPALFIPFRQFKNSKKQKESSTGLGLSISKTIIDAHSGKIWAESEIGEGSTFSFSLPLQSHQGGGIQGM